jgi:hypothetical protein
MAAWKGEKIYSNSTLGDLGWGFEYALWIEEISKGIPRGLASQYNTLAKSWSRRLRIRE